MGGSEAGRTFAVPRMRFVVLERACYRTPRCIDIPLSSEDGIGGLCWAARGFERAAMLSRDVGCLCLAAGFCRGVI
jgi:hypothetical protein